MMRKNECSDSDPSPSYPFVFSQSSRVRKVDYPRRYGTLLRLAPGTWLGRPYLDQMRHLPFSTLKNAAIPHMELVSWGEGWLKLGSMLRRIFALHSAVSDFD